MQKEKRIPSTELEPLAAGLAQTFIQRWDLYPRQLDDGSYICIRKPLTQNHILAHLRGDITLGAYLLDSENQARFVVFDADDQDQMVGLFNITRALSTEGVPNYLERSRRGGHLWLFFDIPASGKEARAFGHGLMAAHGLSDIELYPKQDKLGKGPGSLIRLPFGIHRGDMHRYGFITPYGQPLAPRLRDQIPFFHKPETIPETFFARHLDKNRPLADKPIAKITEGQGRTLSQALKERMSVYEFVSQYVELSPTGRGLCPFHDDQHKSFAVNVETNYWNCFAGCGGGSLIDFWMKRQKCDFKTAVRELAEMIL